MGAAIIAPISWAHEYIVPAGGEGKASASARGQGGGKVSVITVDSAPALAAAMKVAQSGDTIQLAGGVYSGLRFTGNKYDGSGITITSADPAKPAVFTDFVMEDAKGVAFRNVEFQVNGLVGFNVYSSSNIALEHVSMHGSLDNDSSNDGHGIRFFDSEGIRVVNSEFQQLAHAVSIARSSEIVVSSNRIHNIDSDGLDFAQVSKVVVSGNVFHDFRPTDGAHPDAIQFMTARTTTPSQDVLITDNLIYRGGGEYTQGIFFGDEVGNLPFLDVTISYNTIVGTGWSAIRPTHNLGLTIVGNQLISFKGDNETLMLVQNSDRVSSSGNRGVSISIANSTQVTQDDDGKNRVVQDQGAAVIKEWFDSHPHFAPGIATAVKTTELYQDPLPTYVEEGAPPIVLSNITWTGLNVGWSLA